MIKCKLINFNHLRPINKAHLSLFFNSFIYLFFQLIYLENYYYLKLQLVPKSEGIRKEGDSIGISAPVANLSFKEKVTLNVTFEDTLGGIYLHLFIYERINTG